MALKDLIGKTFTRNSPLPKTSSSSDSSSKEDLMSKFGYKTIKINGKEILVPNHIDREDIPTFMEYWKNQMHSGLLDDGQRKILYEIFKKLDEELSEVTMTLDTYADEMFSVGFVDNPIEIEFKGIPKDVSDQVKEILKRNGVLNNYRADGRDLCKFGDVAYRIHYPKDNDPEKIVLTLLTPDKWKVNLTDKSLKSISGYTLEDLDGEESYKTSVVKPVNGKVDLQFYELIQYSIFDNKHFPYGRSLLDGLKNAADHLMTVEALLALSRASKVERLVLKVPVEGSDPISAFGQMSMIKSQWKNLIFKDSSSNLKSSNKTPALQDIIVMPSMEGFEMDKIQSSIDLSSIEDVEYFRDKLLLATRLPKGYFTSDDTVDRGGALAAMDLKFARALIPFQRGYAAGLSKMCLILCYFVSKYKGSNLDIERADVEVKIKKSPQIASELLDVYSKLSETADKLISTYNTYKGSNTPSVGEEEIPNDNSQPISKDPFTGVSGERKYIDLLKKLGMPEDIANIFSDDKKENKKERELKTLSENSVRISSNVIALSEKRRIFDKL